MRNLLLTLLILSLVSSFALAAEIRGTVIDSDGETVSSASVSVYSQSIDRRTNRQITQLVATVRTARDGSFLFDNIRQSQVVIYAYKPGVGQTILRMNVGAVNRPVELQLEEQRSRRRVRRRPNQG